MPPVVHSGIASDRSPDVEVRLPLPRDLTGFVACAYGVAWTVWIGGWIACGRPADLTATTGMFAALALGGFAPTIAAAVMTLHHGGLPALGSWAAACTRWRIGGRAWAAAGLALP